MSDLEHESRDGEWRGHATLLFADLCGYTAIGETHDPEEIDALRRELEQLATRVVQLHGGSVAQIYGDGILAVFGFPKQREDDPRRAVEAALELRDSVRTLQLDDAGTTIECRLHSGVHAGLVFAREGDALNGRYTLSGDAVTTAARLCAAAREDEIVVSEAVLRGIEGFFATAPTSESMSLKGRKAPVTAYRVTGTSGVRNVFEARCRRGLTEFVGRDRELAILQDVLVASSPPRARQLVLRGPAGVGKSRLLEEFRRRIDRASVHALQGYCERYGDIVPLQPLLQMLRELCGIKPKNSIDEASRLAEASLVALGDSVASSTPLLLQLMSLRPPGHAPDSSERAIERAFRALFEALLQQSPLLLLLIDDWQWADEISRKVLDSLASACRDRPISIVLAVRSDDGAAVSSADQVIALQPLDEAESARVIHALRRQSFGLGVTRALHRRSGGNPLFLEELCRALPTDAFGDEGALEQSGAPTTLQGVIQARVGLLSASDARVLKTASVIGSEFSSAMLRSLCPEVDLTVSLAELCHADLIYSTEIPDIFRFKHGIARDVIYESVRMADRRRIHGAVAHALQAAPDGAGERTEALAYHYRGSGDHEQAAHFAELAGAKAMATWALDRARLQYAAALHALDKLPPSVALKRRFLSVSRRWAAACVYAATREQLAPLERAVRYAEELAETGAQAQTQNSLGWIHHVLGDYDAAERHYHAALRLAEAAQSQRLAAQLWANIGQNHSAAGEYEPALLHLSRSIATKRELVIARAGRTSPDGLAYALGNRGRAYADIGDFASADRDISEAREIVGASGRALEGSILAIAAMVEILRGDWGSCIEHAAASRKIAEQVNSDYVFATSSAYLAYARFVSSGSDDALHQLQNGVDWLERRGTKLFLSFSYACLADALVSASDFAAGERYAQRAIERAAERDRLGEAIAYRVLARLRAVEGAEPDQAAMALQLEHAEAAGRARQSPRELAITRLAYARLFAELQPSAADRAADHARREFVRLGMKWHATGAERLLASFRSSTP